MRSLSQHNYTTPLSVLCLAFTLLVLMHSFATPMFEAPDEVWHYAYVRWLAEGHGLPPMDNDASGANQEVAQPPLYYAVAALLSAPFPDDDLALWGNPGFGHQAPGTIPDNKNMLIHTYDEHFPWQGAVLTIHITRLASLLFGLFTVIAAWGLGYATWGGQRGALLTASLVAFHPQFVFISSVINNDSAAAALCTATLWSVAHTLRNGLTTRRALVTGVLSGLAALTKTSAILMLGIAGLGLLWAYSGQCLKADAQGRSPKNQRLSMFQDLASYTIAALLVGGGWYLRNLVLYGDPLGISSHTNTLWGRAAPVSLLALLPEMPLLLRSFWAAYGWGHVTWPDWVYVLLVVSGGWLMLYGIWHTTFSIIQSTRCPKSKGKPIYRLITYLNAQSQYSILILATLWLAGVFAALLQWMRQVEAPHGRLLFPALGAWALLVSKGMLSLHTNHRWPRLLLMLLAILTALAPGTRILATFAPPRLRDPANVTPALKPVNLHYAGKAQLLGITTTTQRAHPGETFSVRACWEALQPMEQDYTVFIHLIGPNNTRAAERHTYPGLGRFPTSLWPVGRAFCDNYRVPIVDWAEGPVRYHLTIGLFDAQNQVRLPAQDDDGNSIEPPIVGALAVVPETSTPTTPHHAINATLNQAIRLRGYNAPQQALAGETISVTLHWEALTQPDADLIAFVHLWRPGESAPYAQDDAPPRDGWYPTSWWRAGDTVSDTHTLNIPPDLAAGSYPLWAGLYRPTDSVRAVAIGPEGPYPHDLIPLGSVVIEAPRK